ncbi:hypothetical protein BDR03DRAFT_957864 [Suillus americanus]|nr:hypothetical protein BDR03DRAFT_957864 [Suillus americanus]
MKQRPWKIKRCNLWDDDKKPRRVKGGLTGCWRNDNDCFFVHPTEREWDTAEPSFPPPAHEVIDNDNDFRYELGSRHRRPSDPSESRRGHPRYTSPSKSPRAYRQDSRNDKRSRSPATSVAESDKLEKLRRDDGYHRRRSITGSSSSFSRRRTPPLDDRGRRGDRARSPRPLSPPRSQMSITKTIMPPPPPPPQGTPPTRPLLPVPIPPSFLSLDKDISHKPPENFQALSGDELRKVWYERVDLLFASVKAREQLSYAEADLKLNKLGESSRMSNTSNVRARTQTEMRYEAKKNEISDCIQKLTASDYWPALKPPHLQSVEAKFVGMKQQISELKDSVSELSTSFSALLRLKDSRSGGPPLKRRRLEGEDATAGSSEATFSLSVLDGIQARLSGVNSQLLDLQNDILQRNTIMEDEIESRINARLEEVEVFPDEDDMNPASAVVTAVVQAETSKALDIINMTDQQLGEVVQEVANLMIQSKGTDDEATRLRQENEQLKTEIVKLKSSAEADAEVVQQNNEQVEALAAALQAYISQAPPPPPQPVIPTHEYLMEELEEHILSSCMKTIEPLLREMKDEVSKMLNAENNAMYQTLWPKIELVLRMVDTVKKGSNIILESEE